MTQWLYPRLEADVARQHVAELAKRPLESVRDEAAAARQLLPVTYGATGGVRVPDAHLERLQRLIRECAPAFPNRHSRERAHHFGFECARVLHANLNAVPGELLRPDVWRYLSAALVPDVTLWRWRDEAGGIVVHRYMGGVRDALGSLWLRAARLGVEPEGPLSELLEDNLVALLERPAQSRHVALCRALARRFLEVRSGTATDQELLRDAMKRVTRLSGFVSFAALDEEQVDLVAQRVLRESQRALGLAAAETSPPGPGVEAVEPDVLPEPPLEFAQPAIGALSELEVHEQSRAVWRHLVGLGAMRVDDAVRRAAIGLREDGRITYARLHDTGQLYAQLRDLLENNAFFDKPIRGHRRALCFRIEDIPDDVLVRSLAEVLPQIEADRSVEDALLDHLGERVGFQRASPQRREALRQRLHALARAGRLNEANGAFSLAEGEGL